MALTSLLATIPAGQSVSNAVDCSSGRVVRIIMPPSWTGAASLSFCTSPDNTTFHDLYHTIAETYATNEVIIPAVTPNSAVVMPTGSGDSFNWVKLRSGNHAAPVVQAADRVFQIIVDVADAAASGGGSDLMAALGAMFAPIVTGAVMNPSIADMVSNPPGSAVVQMQAGNGNYTTMVPPPTWTIFSETLNGTSTSGWWTIDQYGNLIPASTTPGRLNPDDYAVVRCQATNAFGSGVGDCMMTFVA
jgi:hypothetical protein